MEVVRLDSLRPRGLYLPVVTVGNFDGVHRGHQALVAAALAEAKRIQGSAVVLTFEPHPSRILSPDRAPRALMTVSQKAEVLAALGTDCLAVLPFTEDLARLSPTEFARLVLAQALVARMIVVGENFRFGRGRSGDLKALGELGERLGFGVRGVEPVWYDGAPISSTRIRETLSRGAVEAAAALLGRRFFVDGRVVRGAARGRTLGFPTANLDLANETLPSAGVYACWCTMRGGEARLIPAVTNVGRRPTFGGGETTVEAHLLGFDRDLYGCDVRLEFEARLREEKAFPGPEALRAQIQQDIDRARQVLVKP